MNDRERARKLDADENLMELWLQSGEYKRYWIAAHRALIDAAKDQRLKLLALPGGKTSTLKHGDFELSIRMRGDNLGWKVDAEVDPLIVLGALEWTKAKILAAYFGDGE